MSKTILQAESSFDQRLSAREIELVNEMIKTQLHHAARCDIIANKRMALQQKAWDMEIVKLLKKVLEVMGG